MSEAAANPHASRKIGLAYLSVADPELTTGTWRDVMEDIHGIHMAKSTK